jgi:hypothetical protein
LEPSKDTLTTFPQLQFIIPQINLRLASFEDAQVPVFVEIERTFYSRSFAFHFAVTDTATGESQLVEVRFRGP